MNKYLRTADSEWYRPRINGIILCVLAAFVVLFTRLAFLQVIKGEEFRRLSENNSIRLQSIAPPRGLIQDRNSTTLVDNRPSFDLNITLKDARPIKETLQKLALYTGIPQKELMSWTKNGRDLSAYKPVLLKQDIGRDTLAAIEVHKFDLPGISVDIKPTRHYLFNGSAAHLIGYLGEINAAELRSGRFAGCRAGDAIGKFGVEKACETLLRGKRGGRQVEVNATGQVVRVLKTVEAEPGKNLLLTIDHELQQKAEEMLDGRAGAVVALDPQSGEVLAMASGPSFDQNAFVCGMSHDQWNALATNPDRPMQNKALQGEYPPASTYKIVTAIAGLEEGVIDENSTFYCPGYYRLGNRSFRCWRRIGHGSLNVVQAIAQSCDVFFYQVGQQLDVDRLSWYARACGLGSLTGIGLGQEAAGLIPTAAWKKRRTGIAWQAGETLSIAIGQGYNLVTPLQMASLIAAVANGGTCYRPLIIKSVRTADGRIIEEATPHINGHLPASPSTLALVRKGLWRVVNGRRGTARSVRMEDVDICGKTGTAQVYSRKKNSDGEDKEAAAHLKDHAWFVAYAPAEHPRIAVAVIIEHGEHGGSAAAPVAGELIKTYLKQDETDSVIVTDEQNNAKIKERG